MVEWLRFPGCARQLCRPKVFVACTPGGQGGLSIEVRCEQGSECHNELAHLFFRWGDLHAVDCGKCKEAAKGYSGLCMPTIRLFTDMARRPVALNESNVRFPHLPTPLELCAAVREARVQDVLANLRPVLTDHLVGFQVVELTLQKVLMVVAPLCQPDTWRFYSTFTVNEDTTITNPDFPPERFPDLHSFARQLVELELL